MLKRLGNDEVNSCTTFEQAKFDALFEGGLEYSSPVRGTWNIVHTGMLIPEAHEIFVCAEACLRGVVLTAAEMNASERFSTIEIRENNVTDGDMEYLIIEGVTDILNKLKKKPKAVLVYTSCIHHFMGCDLNMVYLTLRERFKYIDFTDCYMNPIMRKSGLTPDQIMRKQLYSLLKEREHDSRKINIIGNDLATDKSCEIYEIVKKAGLKITEITDCKSYEEYQTMAEGSLNIVYNPAAVAAGEELLQKLKQEYIYLPISYEYEEIKSTLNTLSRKLKVSENEYTDKIVLCEDALADAKKVIGDIEIAIDYTLTFRPLSLAKLLITHGFNVTRIYADAFISEETEDFLWFKENAPQIKIYSTTHVEMRVVDRKNDTKILALGQKAAYFTGSDNFVNIVECGGYYGFIGIIKLAELMKDAFCEKKEARKLIQIKGLGCGCII